MKSFPAQLKTRDYLIDVMIRLDERAVEIESDGETLGRWPRSQCTFERHAPDSYRFSADGETVGLRVTDDHGFKSAIDLIRHERVQLVPPSLVAAGVAAVAGAFIAMSLFGASEEPARAADAPPAASVTIPPTDARATAPLNGADPATPSEAPPAKQTPLPDDTAASARVLAERWNDVAAGTSLTVVGPGLTVVNGRLSIQIDDDRITVTSIPGGNAGSAQQLVAALGLTVAAAEPDLAPNQRATVLTELGIDIDGANPHPIDATVTRGPVVYRLDFLPGERLVLIAGLEW
jgi:hypothetical protein